MVAGLKIALGRICSSIANVWALTEFPRTAIK